MTHLLTWLRFISLSISISQALLSDASDETADGTIAVGHSPGASVAADGAADPATGIAIDTADAPAGTITTTTRGEKRRRKRNHAARASRKHHRQMADFAATHDGGTPGPGLDPDEGHSAGG